MACLVILLLFALIQWLAVPDEEEGKGVLFLLRGGGVRGWRVKGLKLAFCVQPRVALSLQSCLSL